MIRPEALQFKTVASQLLKRKIKPAVTRIDFRFHPLLYVGINYSGNTICIEATTNNVAVKFKLNRLQILLRFRISNRAGYYAPSQ